MYQPDKLFPLPESLPAETVRGFSADLTGLIAWLSTQDPEAAYRDMSVDDCLLCRFFSVVAGEPTGWNAAQDMVDATVFDALWAVAEVGIGRSTYRDALSRARSALRDGEMK